MVIETERLVLRRWEPRDDEPFANLNADPRVMEFFPKTLTHGESTALIKEIERRIDRHGFGLWATELKGESEFIGFIGLNVPRYRLPFSPCVEIGWRLGFDHWRNGYAQEGARAALAFGFERMNLKEIVSFTTVNNARSRHMMERIGMTHDGGADFDHPGLPENHHLKRHVLYRKIIRYIVCEAWEFQVILHLSDKGVTREFASFRAKKIVGRYSWKMGMFADVFIGYFITLFRLVIRTRRGYRTQGWPQTTATVSYASCQSSVFMPRPVAEIVYTYRLDGAHYGGADEKPFFLESSAEGYARQFSRGDSLVIRVKPGQPDVSFVRDADQST